MKLSLEIGLASLTALINLFDDSQKYNCCSTLLFFLQNFTQSSQPKMTDAQFAKGVFYDKTPRTMHCHYLLHANIALIWQLVLLFISRIGMIEMLLEPFRQNLRRFLRKVSTTTPKLDMIGRNLLLPPQRAIGWLPSFAQKLVYPRAKTALIRSFSLIPLWL